MEGSVWAEAGRDGGGERLRPWWGTALRRGNEGEKRGERRRSSPRTSRAARCGRGRVGDGESESAVDGVGGGRRWRLRLHRASGGSWLDEEVEGVVAELGSVSGRRGEAGGDGYGERRRPTRSDTGERERGRGEEESGKSERVRGGCVASSGVPGRRGGSRQAGREVAWRGGARARRARAVPLSGRKTTEEEAGWAACWLGRPAAAGLHRGKPQVSFSSLFLFSILFFLTLVLI